MYTSCPFWLMFLHQVLCVIVENEEDIAAFKDYTPDVPAAAASQSAAPPAPPPAAAQPAKPVSAPSQTVAPSAGASGHIAASPYARTLAKQKGIDLAVSLVQ